MMIKLLFIGLPELMVIACVALLLCGVEKLPRVMRGLGQGVKELKKGVHEVSEPVEELKDVIKKATDLSSNDTMKTESDGSEHA